MSLISTIKSILGLGGTERAEQGTTVTVERDADVTTDSDLGTSGDSAPASTTDAAVEETPRDERSDAAEESAVTAAATDVDASDGSADEVEDTGAAAEGEPVETITGIGPAYAERLANAGVHSVDDLAAADATELADAIDVSETRIEGWIEQASSN